MIRRCGTVSALLAFLAVVLCACTGGSASDAPTTMHPGTAPTRTSATPTENPTDAGAAASVPAVQRMYAEYNAMLKSLSSVGFRRTFSTACSYCVADANQIDEIADRNETIRGGQVRLSGLRVAYKTDKLVVVEGYVMDSPAVIYKGGRVVERFAGGTRTRLVWHVEAMDNTWLVTKEEPVQ